MSVTGPGPFSFVSADVSSGSSLADQFSTYVITGFLGDRQVFTQTGSVPGSPANAFVTVNAAEMAVSIDRLIITEGGGGSSLSSNLDNIVVQAATATVPEPASLALLTVALLGGLVLARHRSV